MPSDETARALDLLGKLPRHHGEETTVSAPPATLAFTAGPAAPEVSRPDAGDAPAAPATDFVHLFPELPAFAPAPQALAALAGSMVDNVAAVADHPTLPAGYTYLGQLIDHDLTFDLAPLSAPPGGTVPNFRSARLDLDSLYGLGPTGTPFLYRHDDPQLFLVGRTDTGRPNDLPRAEGGTALIGDPRDDENLIVAQLHVALLKFHNKVLTDWVRPNLPPQFDDFDETRRIVTFHYQYLVLHDFLGRVTMPGTVADVLTNGRRFYTFDPHAGPQIPVEFSVAAYRFGHSLVRENYNYNRNFPGASLAELFQFTASSGAVTTTIPDIWVADWRRLFPVLGHENVPFGMTLTRPIDNLLTSTLHHLPKSGPNPPSLAQRNLQRGVQRGLPSGQDVADRMGLPKLSPADLTSGPDANVVRVTGFDRRSPLWWYLLKEAQLLGGGRTLGPVGSRIVAEVFVGLLEGDPGSFLRIKRDWVPELPSGFPPHYEIADLLNWLGDLNPLG
jgi:hypothetical protein